MGNYLSGRRAFPVGRPEPEGVVHSPEANLHKHILCDKNPGHSQFIPVDDFSTQHFPPCFRDAWRVQWVKALAELTVHLKVKAISKDRPATYPGDNRATPFPFHKPGGGSQPRTGSGFVWAIYKCGEGGWLDVDKTCVCDDCVDCTGCVDGYKSPHKTWWEVFISTALHVTFDSEEVNDTEVRFFYNNASSVKLVSKGCELWDADMPGDRCVFKTIVHDAAVGRRLETARQTCDDLIHRHVVQPGEPVIAVSHPHGCPKHITIGNFVTEDVAMDLWCPFSYTTSTCPGSSGCVIASGWRDLFYRVYPHSAALSDGRNKSGKWFFS